MQAMLVMACRLGVILAASILLPLLAVCGLPVSSSNWTQAISSWTNAGVESSAALFSQPFDTPSETPLRYRVGPAPVRLALNEAGDSLNAVTAVALSDATAAAVVTDPGTDATILIQGQALERLRSLGATFYRLRPWGADAGLFRFEARVPLGADAALQRLFDAVDSNPQAAVERVLAEVETLHAARVH